MFSNVDRLHSTVPKIVPKPSLRFLPENENKGKRNVGTCNITDGKPVTIFCGRIYVNFVAGYIGRSAIDCVCRKCFWNNPSHFQ